MNIELKNIAKRFGNGFEIKNLNLHIPSKQFTTFLGPSGCGKTTILRMIAGLETPDEGEIWFYQTPVFSSKQNILVPPEKRNLGFVFQDFALWPHMKIYENVAFPLRAKKQTEHIDQKVKEALHAVQLAGFENRYPDQLSGGQQQRVAFARAIVADPQCILFDEPLSALDAILRDEMRTEIKRLTERLGITSVFVTHDQIEAMSMSDEIVVLNQGKVEQIGTPEQIYATPESRFVASFIGRSNWIDQNHMFRPEALHVSPVENSERFRTEVVGQQYLGNAYEVYLDANGQKWSMLSPARQEGSELSVYIKQEDIKSFA